MIKVIDDDLGRSGTGTKHRPGWIEMLRLITTGTVSAVFVWMVSRLSRELRDFEELRVLCKVYGVVMIIDGRPADPRDPNDTVLMQIEAILAQHDNHVRAKMLTDTRREMARRGCVVSRLPTGWVRLPDGTYAFDPEVRAAIADIIHTFWQARSVLGTVRLLSKAGKEIPARRRLGVEWVRPHARLVHQFLTHPAYTGTYVHNRSEGHPELGEGKAGYPVRRKAPEEHWIQTPGHHPAYLSPEEQHQIKEILKGNRFDIRDRPRKGAALCQKLLRCARCGTTLGLNYPRRVFHYYRCQRNTTTYAGKRCIDVSGRGMDAAVEQIVLGVLRTPPRLWSANRSYGV